MIETMKVKTVARCFLLLHFLAQNFCYILASGKECKLLGSGCGSVDRAAASDTRDLHFKSSHQQNFIYQLYNRKDKNKQKEARNIFKKIKKECSNCRPLWWSSGQRPCLLLQRTEFESHWLLKIYVLKSKTNKTEAGVGPY